MEEQSGEGRKKSTQNFTTRNLFSVSIQIFAYICLLATLLCFSLCQIKKITHPDLFRASFTSFPYFIRYHCIISLLQYKKVRFNLDGTTSVWKGSSTGCTERLWMLNPLRFSRRVWMGPLAAWSTAWFSGQQPCLWQDIRSGWSLRSLPTQAILWLNWRSHKPVWPSLLFYAHITPQSPALKQALYFSRCTALAWDLTILVMVVLKENAISSSD